MARRRFVQVILPLKLEWEPVYSLDEEILGAEAVAVAEGTRVRVDFAGKEYIGVVSNADASKEAESMRLSSIKPVASTALGLHPVSKQEMSLWRQVASYYLCTVGEVYKAAYPAGKTADEEAQAQRERKAELRARAKLEAEEAKRKRAEQRAAKKAEREAALAARRGKKRTPPVTEQNAADGPMSLRAQGQAMTTAPASGEWAMPAQGQDQIQCQGQALGQVQEPPEAGLARREVKLSPEQTEAYSQIKLVIGSGKTALLHGVTGSGKTEVYLKLAGEALEAGLNVLYLAPEIALSRQLEDRLRAVFPGELRVFHSAQTAAGRREAAAFLRDNPYIVLGTRSALFLPHRKLGLVIVDEEHDSSYKQDSPAPRYNARETAIMLARTFNSGVVLGSATPSLESLYNCRVGRFGLVRLGKKYFGAEEAEVEIIDTIAERRKNGMVGNFSRKLIALVEDRLSKGEQVVLLRERRAYSPVVQCESCGRIPRCKRCNVPLSLHRLEDGSGRLTCHYCGRSRPEADACPDCGGRLRSVGAGTQRIEEEARQLFPNARIARLDSDSTTSRSYEKEVVKSFSKGETDILVGTQIVTKGFDFSGLTLVAVLQADSILGQEDFRADERGLQMLEQFRGRCGRRGRKGLFAIQTSQPQHPVYQALAGRIAENELQGGLLEERRVFEYPPFSRALNIIAKDYNLPRLEFLSSALAERLGRCGLPESVRLIGPHAPTVDKVAGQHIRLLRLLLPKDRGLVSNKERIAKALAEFERERKYTGHFFLDVDPA